MSTDNNNYLLAIATYINESRVVSLLDVVEDGGLVEAGEVGHVLLLVVLGRVHLLHVILPAEQTKRFNNEKQDG